MQIGNNFGFVLAQRTNGQHLSRIDCVSNFLFILMNFIQLCVWTLAISDLRILIIAINAH